MLVYQRVKPFRIQPAVNCRPWQGKASSKKAPAAARWRANAVATSARPRGIFFRETKAGKHDEHMRNLWEIIGFHGILWDIHEMFCDSILFNGI